MLKASFEVKAGREAVVKLRWVNQISNGRECESKVFNPIKAEAYGELELVMIRWETTELAEQKGGKV